MSLFIAFLCILFVIIIALLTNRKQENEEDKIAKNDVNEHD